MRKLLLAIAGLVLVACSGTGSVEACWEDAVNDPEDGCHQMTDPEAVDWCLAYWYDWCVGRSG